MLNHEDQRREMQRHRLGLARVATLLLGSYQLVLVKHVYLHQ